jgi:hypothetical protein
MASLHDAGWGRHRRTVLVVLLRRAVAVLLLVLVLAGAAVALLSGRAPEALDRATDRAVAEVQAVEESTGRDLVSRSDVPVDAEMLGHGLLFGALTIALALAVGRRVPVVVVAALVFVASVGFEVAQSRLTSSRLAEPRDLVANAVGIAVASVVVLTGRLLTRPRRQIAG